MQIAETGFIKDFFHTRETAAPVVNQLNHVDWNYDPGLSWSAPEIRVGLEEWAQELGRPVVMGLIAPHSPNEHRAELTDSISNLVRGRIGGVAIVVDPSMSDRFVEKALEKRPELQELVVKGSIRIIHMPRRDLFSRLD